MITDGAMQHPTPPTPHPSALMPSGHLGHYYFLLMMMCFGSPYTLRSFTVTSQPTFLRLDFCYSRYSWYFFPADSLKIRQNIATFQSSSLRGLHIACCRLYTFKPVCWPRDVQCKRERHCFGISLRSWRIIVNKCDWLVMGQEKKSTGTPQSPEGQQYTACRKPTKQSTHTYRHRQTEQASCLKPSRKAHVYQPARAI